MLEDMRVSAIREELAEARQSAAAWRAIAEYREREINRLVYVLEVVRKRLASYADRL